MAGKPTVYIETTVVSYLTAWQSRDVIRLGQQQTTREWWDTQRQRFDLLSSQLVHVECAAGDPAAAADRLALLKDIAVLDVTDAATAVGDALVAAGAIPSVATRDALHVGVCAVNGVQFLATWNFRHLANARMQDSIRETCEALGYRAPVICSPEALFE
jgi:predicted nucleic acid-binding protein